MPGSFARELWLLPMRSTEYSDSAAPTVAEKKTTPKQMIAAVTVRTVLRIGRPWCYATR